MIIEIKKDIFNDLSNLQNLNYLLAVFSDNRRYNYFCEFNEIKDTETYKNLPKVYQELIEENFNYIVNQSSKINYIVDQNTSADSFNIDESKIFFSQPFLLILENNLNDAYFVDALIKNFKNKSKIIKKHKENRWLLYENGGGATNIINCIEGIIKSFSSLPKDGKKYLKCMVLVDSDKEHETVKRKTDKENLFKFLDENNIPYHELEKREIENYLPDEVLESIPEIDNYIQSYLKLSPKQKDYFDLEKGFNNRNFNSLSKEIQELFAGIDEKEIGVLRKGMTIAKYEKENNFKSEFPKLFLHEKVTQETLKKRTAHQVVDPDELSTVLNKITQLL